ncbi:DUF4221 family protein [Algoriphagus sp.]|uniref:DUF4221 family protein n=1 Tax=Algoriphagus sp. TaxID=1872435 RepID=UPI00391B4C09
MKYLYWITLLFLLAFCAEKAETEKKFVDKFSISFDTVMVDSDGEFIDLRDNLFFSGLSPDKSYLINFNRTDVESERINLDELVFEKRIKYEKEGPNGIGTMISSLNVSDSDQVLVWFYGLYAFFDQNGVKTRDLELDKIAPDQLLGSEVYPQTIYEDLQNKNRVIGLFFEWKENIYFLVEFDLANRISRKIELPEFAKINEYKTEILINGNFAGNLGGSVFSTQGPDKLVLSSSVINEIQIFDLVKDSLFSKSWETPLLGAKRKYIGPKQFEYSIEEMEDISKKSEEDINYGEFIWDEVNEKFYRFSSKKKLTESKNEEGYYTIMSAEVFLSVFDKELELIGEALIPEITTAPKKHFTKDGKIWIFENIDDELAFIRLTFN